MAADHYCTYFDHRYAALGIAMLKSVRRHGGAGTIWVLCLDEAAEHIMRSADVPDIRIVPLAELEAHFPELERARADRSTVEYYFTLTPHIIGFVFDCAAEAKRVAYLDCDLFFFGPLAEVWEAVGEAPVAIIPHNFNKGAQHLAKYGTYNVGWVSFARSEQGMRCLQFWMSSCREWCRDVSDNGRFADQGYLDRFHEFAPDLAVLQHKGFNMAPWNVDRYDIRFEDGRVMADGDPLIFFHFTGFKKGLAGHWFNSHRGYRTRTTSVMRDRIYRPYLEDLVEAREFTAPLLPAEPEGLKRNRGGGGNFRAWAFKLSLGFFRLLDLVTGKSLAETGPGQREPQTRRAP